MDVTRRSFLGGAISGAILPFAAGVDAQCERTIPPRDRFDPWVEVDPAHLRFNAKAIARLTKGRPILAVVKNNAYGLGLVSTARILAQFPEIAGLAVVKAEDAVALRDAKIKKPILLMGMCSLAEGHELVARGVQLSLYTDGASGRIAALATKASQPIRAQIYLDTGLGRLGMPYHRALPWIRELASLKDLQITGTFMAFTEEVDFDPEQLARFRKITQSLTEGGVNIGRLHAASSNGVFHLPQAHLNLVRPGIALYGAYPSRPEEEKAKATLRPAVRLRARVVRVERLRKGDSVGYGRKYVASKPVWVATLPAGHGDGVPRKSVDGARVLIGHETFPVVGSVSASHCILELGELPAAKVGDVATLVGPDHPDIHPNTLATATGVSVYDVLMHLNPSLPRYML